MRSSQTSKIDRDRDLYDRDIDKIFYLTYFLGRLGIKNCRCRFKSFSGLPIVRIRELLFKKYNYIKMFFD